MLVCLAPYSHVQIYRMRDSDGQSYPARRYGTQICPALSSGERIFLELYSGTQIYRVLTYVELLLALLTMRSQCIA